MTTRRTIVLLIALGALALPETAEATWQYTGRLADGHRTPFELVVRHVERKPRLLIYAASGRLHLQCPAETQLFRWTFQDPFPVRLGVDGHFGIRGTNVYGLSGGRRRVVHIVFDGRVRRSRAAGILHI